MSVPEQNSQAQPATEAQKPNDKEYNFAQLRKQLEQERQARLQYEQRLAQIEEERQKPKQVDDSDDDDSEPYVDQKKLKKTLAREKDELRKEFKQAVRQEAAQLIEQERQTSFLEANPDFNEILTQDHIQKFAAKHPAMAKAMLKMPDNFERQQLLYENIKALGVHKPPEAPKPSIQDEIKNNRKPLYYQPSGQGAAPYANNGDFSKEGQKNAYAKMKELINNRRG